MVAVEVVRNQLESYVRPRLAYVTKGRQFVHDETEVHLH